MILGLAGSTPRAKAGRVAVAKLTQRMCSANSGAFQLKIVAIAKVEISATFPTNKN